MIFVHLIDLKTLRWTVIEEVHGIDTFLQYKGIEFSACIEFEGKKSNIDGNTTWSGMSSDIGSLLEFRTQR